MTLQMKNTAVQIDFWFATVLAFLLLFFPNGNAAWCFAFCIMHEFGHLSTMLAFKRKPEKIQFGFFGMKIVTGNSFLSPVKEIIIATSGPLVNLTLAAIFYSINKSEIALINLGLGVFNLMPVPMLDGGHVLLSAVRNERTVKITGFVCCVLLIILGIITAVQTKRNFTVLSVAVYLLIGCITG